MRQLKLLFLSLLLPFLMFAQGRTVSGRITDAGGRPVAGASIAVEKSTTGTVTDADGRFTLAVPANASVVISSAGFRTQTIKADDAKASFEIKLEEDFAKLDEV